ncbi:unnamed protein product, partial [Mesocestoides corti]
MPVKEDACNSSTVVVVATPTTSKRRKPVSNDASFRDGCFILECLLPTPANIPMPIPASNDETLDPVCKLPKEVGPCRAAYRRWTYDLSKGQCVEFTYGGCRGNANNFETKEACEAKCGG